MSKLLRACRDGDIETARKELETIAPDVTNDDGYTPLMNAAAHGHDEIISLLLEKGAQIDAQDRYGLTSLMKAASYGYLSTVKLLVSRGATTTIKNSFGRTAADEAAKYGKTEIAQFLSKK